MQILTDGNPHKSPWMVPPRIRHPPRFAALPFHQSHLVGYPSWGRDRRASWSATGRGNDPSMPESLLGRARGLFWWAGQSPDGTRQCGGRESTRGILGTQTARRAGCKSGHEETLVGEKHGVMRRWPRGRPPPRPACGLAGIWQTTKPIVSNTTVCLIDP